MKHIWVICAIALLTACIGPNEGETSIIAFSGPYIQKDKASPGLLYRAMSGDDSKHDRTITVLSGIILENDAGDEYKIKTLAGYDGHMAVTHLGYAYVKPGTYHLTGTFLFIKANYNGKLCGDMTVTVKPNETVYIGGLRMPDGFDITKGNYRYFVPNFADEIDANYYENDVKRMGSGETRWHKGKIYRKAIFVNPMKDPPVACTEKAETLF